MLSVKHYLHRNLRFVSIAIDSSFNCRKILLEPMICYRGAKVISWERTHYGLAVAIVSGTLSLIHDVTDSVTIFAGQRGA